MLENLTPPVRNQGSCKVATISKDLSEQDREILLAAVSNAESWPVKTLARALNERGIQLSDTPISNHRAKSCACFRT